MQKHSGARDLLRFQVEHKSKEPYLKAYKGDKNNMQLICQMEEWNMVQNLEKAAQTFHPDFKNFWKWVKKVHNLTEPMEIRQMLFNALYFVSIDNQEELKKWKVALQAENQFYYPSCF